jgi:hypothetical protein
MATVGGSAAIRNADGFRRDLSPFGDDLALTEQKPASRVAAGVEMRAPAKSVLL